MAFRIYLSVCLAGLAACLAVIAVGPVSVVVSHRHPNGSTRFALKDVRLVYNSLTGPRYSPDVLPERWELSAVPTELDYRGKWMTRPLWQRRLAGPSHVVRQIE